MSDFLVDVARFCQEPRHRAVLWRNQGETLATARNMGFLWPLLLRQGNEDIHFLVATLLASDRKALSYFKEQPDNNKALPNVVSTSLGATLDFVEADHYKGVKDTQSPNKLKKAASPDPQRRESPYERRLRRLLDARLDWDGSGEIPFLLRQCVHQVCTPDAPPCIHWPNLLRDLRHWNDASKWVQKRWARDFYGVQNLTDTDTTDKENDENAD